MTIDSLVRQIMQEVNDLPPWAYTYKKRPTDLLEVRASELEAILHATLEPAGPARGVTGTTQVARPVAPSESGSTPLSSTATMCRCGHPREWHEHAPTMTVSYCVSEGECIGCDMFTPSDFGEPAAAEVEG